MSTQTELTLPGGRVARGRTLATLSLRPKPPKLIHPDSFPTDDGKFNLTFEKSISSFRRAEGKESGGAAARGKGIVATSLPDGGIAPTTPGGEPKKTPGCGVGRGVAVPLSKACINSAGGSSSARATIALGTPLGDVSVSGIGNAGMGIWHSGGGNTLGARTGNRVARRAPRPPAAHRETRSRTLSPTFRYRSTISRTPSRVLTVTRAPRKANTICRLNPPATVLAEFHTGQRFHGYCHAWISRPDFCERDKDPNGKCWYKHMYPAGTVDEYGLIAACAEEDEGSPQRLPGSPGRRAISFQE